jgi:hypothetical protein
MLQSARENSPDSTKGAEAGVMSTEYLDYARAVAPLPRCGTGKCRWDGSATLPTQLMDITLVYCGQEVDSGEKDGKRTS